MLSGASLFIILSYVLMVAAFMRPQNRGFHVPVLGGIMLLDIIFPVYLVITRFDSLVKELIDQGEIPSFMVWMHLIVVILLYVLYVFQFRAGQRMLKGDAGVRHDHRNQGKAILVTRGLVILTSMMLVDAPDSVG